MSKAAALVAAQLPVPGPLTEPDVTRTNFGIAWQGTQAAPQSGGTITCFDVTLMPLYGGKECDPASGNATCCTTGTASRTVAVRELVLYPGDGGRQGVN
jgi:hypothetical protein